MGSLRRNLRLPDGHRGVEPSRSDAGDFDARRESAQCLVQSMKVFLLTDSSDAHHREVLRRRLQTGAHDGSHTSEAQSRETSQAAVRGVRRQ